MAYVLQDVIFRSEGAPYTPHRPLTWPERALLGSLMIDLERRFEPKLKEEYDRVARAHGSNESNRLELDLDKLLDPAFAWTHEATVLAFLLGQRHGFRLGCHAMSTVTAQGTGAPFDMSQLVAAQTDDNAADLLLGQLAAAYTPPNLVARLDAATEGGLTK